MLKLILSHQLPWARVLCDHHPFPIIESIAQVFPDQAIHTCPLSGGTPARDSHLDIIIDTGKAENIVPLPENAERLKHMLLSRLPTLRSIPLVLRIVTGTQDLVTLPHFPNCIPEPLAPTL